MNKAGHIHIYYSARVNVLVEALNQNIKNHYHDHQDPLKPLSVIVPNGHIQKYLNLRLTEINGISANIQYPFLETGLYDAALSLYPANQKPQQLTVDQIELAIWGFLGDTNHQKTPSLSPLFDYLKPHENTALRAQKRWQLAQQLALLFIDYELSRPEMIDAWLAHQLFYANSQNERLKQVEMAQRTVYQAIFDQTSNQCTLSGLLRQLKSPQAIEVQPLLLFVPSRLTPLHRRIILLVAQHYPVHIYHLNVCREFWLDMETDAEINWRQRIQQLHLNATDETGQTIKTADNHNAGQLTGEAFFDLEQGLSALENPLLKAWGKPGRETLRLLSDLENDAIHAGVPYQDDLLDEHPDNQTKTAQCTLSALQQGILDRIPHDRNHRNLDNTLQVANAPSIEAEVTHVYNGILYELQQNPSLQLTDIAVLVTDMTAYRYVIEQVFERLNLHARSPLRYSISDSNAGEESLYARAVIQLLTILETDFIRDEVFEWLANPCVMTALNSHQHEVDAWLQAAVDLGIYRGFKQLYKAPDEDTAILFTWQQGLQRLHRSLVQADADNSPLGRHELGRLSVIMTQLYAFQSQLKEQLSGEQWQQTLQTMFDTFIAISDEHPQEDAVALAVTRHLQQLVDSRAQLALSFADIKQYLLSRLQTISAGRGRYLSGGVVCAALQPMRPVPFKISFIMGLGESQFPGQSRQNTLDLASYSRRIGDTDQVDNHKYLFLETVMSTEQKLFLSYVGRDEQTGDPLATSVVVNDVMDWLKKHTENHLKPLILPLSPADVFKQSAQQKSAVMHNFLLSDYLLYHHKIQPGKAILETDIKDITQSQKQLLQQFNGVFHPGEVSAIDDSLAESPGPVDSRDLANYLINPTETVFAQQGGVLTRIEDTELLSDEPISLNPLDRHNIVSRAVERDLGLHLDHRGEAEATAKPEHLADTLEQTYGSYLQQSRVPIKLFAQIEPLKAIQDLQEYQSLKASIESGQLIPWRGPLVLGQRFSQQSPEQTLTELTVNSASDEAIQLTATIPYLLNNPSQGIAGQVIIRASIYSQEKSHELLIKAFVDWCLMSLHNDLKLLEEFQVWLIFQDKVLTWCFNRHLLDAKMMEHYLVGIVADFMRADKSFLPLSLSTKMTIKSTQKGPDTATKIHAFKNNYYFAYDHVPESWQVQLQHNYQQALIAAGEVKKKYGTQQSMTYDEIKTLLAYPAAKDVLTTYKSRFMLFFATIEALDIRNPI